MGKHPNSITIYIPDKYMSFYEELKAEAKLYISGGVGIGTYLMMLARKAKQMED